MQELTSYPSSFWWNAKLGSWIPGLACHFPKRTRFCYQRPERPIFGDQLQKIMNWYIQSLNADLPLCDGMQNLVVVFPVWLWHVISQRWKRGTDFVISAQKWQFGQFSAVNCAKLWILTFKVSMKKLTSYISSLRWYTKLGGGILGLAVACHFPNVTKGQDFVIRAQKYRFCQFLVINYEKLWAFTSKVSMQKLTNYLSSLQCYVKIVSSITSLSVSCHFPKVTKKDGILSSPPKNANSVNFWRLVATNCEFLPS